jgi:hypothetical protein
LVQKGGEQHTASGKIFHAKTPRREEIDLKMNRFQEKIRDYGLSTQWQKAKEMVT